MLRRFLHRQLWQRLPPGARSAMLQSVAARLAPRAALGKSGAEPIIIAGVLTSSTGLGQSARLCYQALEQAGLEVYAVDLSETLMQARNVDFSFRDGRAMVGNGTIIAHVNSPILPVALLKLGRTLLDGKRIVGVWHWELPRVPAAWSGGVPFVDEIWVSSHFTQAAISSIAAGKPVKVLPHPVAAYTDGIVKDWEKRERSECFTVLSMFDTGSSFARKNPLAAIAAFRRAFANDRSTRLIVKTQNTSLYPAGLRRIEEAVADADNIDLITQSMSREEVASLYARSDVLLSLHRAEGFGLPIAEAMLAGLPVVATNWSANTDFLTRDHGFPIDYHLVPALDEQRTYHDPSASWAEADVEQAAAALVRLRSEEGLGRRLGTCGRQFALKAWGAEGYARSVRAMIEQRPETQSNVAR